MTGNMQVVLEGKGPVTLRPNDHVATGGEGSIYKVGGLAVKMYLDPLKMRQAGLPDKINLLSRLVHPFVVGPRGLVLNSASEAVGHYLPFVENGKPLSMVFTNEFWTKEGFDQNNASDLVSGMRDAVDFAHQHAALLIDANELNWFALLTGKAEPRIIDVDSWAIGKWPASVIMPSIRDWNSKTFGEGTDWFAWGVVTFQVYTGLHPYKGTLAGFDRGDLVGRMKARASVFSPNIKLNRAVRDFSMIPGALLSWYEAAFQQRERSKPPSPFDSAISHAPTARTARTVVIDNNTGVLAIEKLFGIPNDPVIRVFFCGIAQTASGDLWEMESKRLLLKGSKDCEIVKVGRGWLLAEKSGLAFISEDTVRAEPLSLHLACRSFLSYENRMFAVTESGLAEVKVHNFGKPVASFGQTWGILINSTRWFAGVGVLDAMGAMYVVVPFGEDSVSQVRIKELDGRNVVAGKAGSRFVSMIAIDRQGTYSKIELTFDKDYAMAPKVWQGAADSAEMNVAILPKGVCATILKDGELDIFVPANGNVRRIEDRQVATDMALTDWRDRVIFIQNGDVWSLRVK